MTANVALHFASRYLRSHFHTLSANKLLTAVAWKGLESLFIHRMKVPGTTRMVDISMS